MPDTPVSTARSAAPAAGKPEKHNRQEFMVGECPAMKEVFYRIRRFAQCDAPILISGETGTGKELAAQAVHQRSARANGPFIAINCAALPASLIASELFGYEKGAFTGAAGRKIGLIEQANGGTLFLDEIGDLPLDLQGHLLRFLQEQTITRIGGHLPIQVDARVISASHVHLDEAMAAGTFRDDLFYRLNVLPLHMPALRERENDIELMATFFLRKIAAEFGRDVCGFTEATRGLIRSYAWPGNVRELIAAIRRGVVMGAHPLLCEADLGLQPQHPLPAAPPPSGSPKPQKLRAGSIQELNALQQALARNHHNVTKAAAELGVSRVTLYRMAKRHAQLGGSLHPREH